MLNVMDRLWIQHLTAIDDLREGIGLRAYGQRDPLIEYKVEAARMFDDLQAAVRADVVNAIYHLQMRQQAPPPPPPTEAAFAHHPDPQAEAGNGTNGTTRRATRAASPARGGVATAARATASKVGRNDPCPCGSGKKFKRCHGGV
jgi:preprotein translocase subunit SecA